ncbi:hypothetical protein SKAU_G00311200 [Synaphobranchus kaupii]|uniref:Uncharacterized protein n=1 Tax=Synaphobranchus kaupii TaxID=118154 RepID=A0A9Q1ERN1_SYNKA|nr:hypothetical protein SKAU_G00311200 [Synaphobranchus kaupii]
MLFVDFMLLNVGFFCIPTKEQQPFLWSREGRRCDARRRPGSALTLRPLRVPSLSHCADACTSARTASQPRPPAVAPASPPPPGRSGSELTAASHQQLRKKGNHFVPQSRLFQSNSNLFSYYYQKQLQSIT